MSAVNTSTPVPTLGSGSAITQYPNLMWRPKWRRPKNPKWRRPRPTAVTNKVSTTRSGGSTTSATVAARQLVVPNIVPPVPQPFPLTDGPANPSALISITIITATQTEVASGGPTADIHARHAPEHKYGPAVEFFADDAAEAAQEPLPCTTCRLLGTQRIVAPLPSVTPGLDHIISNLNLSPEELGSGFLTITTPAQHQPQQQPAPKTREWEEDSQSEAPRPQRLQTRDFEDVD